jgi:hypothetical protein
MPMAVFNYEPLLTREHEIRLFRTPPKVVNGARERIHMDVFHMSLYTGPVFKALSYAWGDPDACSTVYLNGQPVQVTRNLSEALANLQCEHAELTMWIDALCINQADALEKTSQVQLMRTIYESAEEVKIWLSPSNPQTDLTMQQIRELGTRLLEMGIWGIANLDQTESDDPETKRVKGNVKDLAIEYLEQVVKQVDPFWWVMSDLGQRSWFKRIWCIQECANAQTATLRCGQQEADFRQY